MKKEKPKVSAEDVLTGFIKANIKRDFSTKERDYYTVSISTALKAMRKYLKVNHP